MFKFKGILNSFIYLKITGSKGLLLYIIKKSFSYNTMESNGFSYNINSVNSR